MFEDVSRNMVEDRSRKLLEKYRPIFDNNIPAPTSYPNILYIVDKDERMKIKECAGAIGFEANINNADVLGIYQKDVNKFREIEFYPNKKPSVSIYYVHPLNNFQYIDITEYFTYLKEQRISELEYIAQELGAKHFVVSILEEKMSNNESETSLNTKFGTGAYKGGIAVSKNSSQKSYEKVGIAAESNWPGREPKEPKLKMWANNESIRSLVKQRLSSDNRLQSKTFRLDYNTSSGIKEKEAAKVDGVLKEFKFSAAGEIQKKAQEESRKIFEYTIEF